MEYVLKTFLERCRNVFRLRAHGNVLERIHLCFHAKTDANTNNLLQKLELIQYIENIFPWSVKTGRQNDKRDESVFENARKRRPCALRE